MAHTIHGEKVPEWTTETIDDKRFALKRKGIVVKVFYTQEDMKEWWGKRFPDQGPAPEPGVVIDRAIRNIW